MKANTVERTARNLRTACRSHIDARLRGILLTGSPISEIILSAQEVAHPSYGTPSRHGPVGAINIATSVTREITERCQLETLYSARNANILRAVTHGLAAQPKLRRVDHDWLKEVPAHWEVCRVKRVLARMDYGISVSTIE